MDAIAHDFELRFKMRQSSFVEIPDTLIAATTEVNGLILATGNAADYRFLPRLSVKTFRP